MRKKILDEIVRSRISNITGVLSSFFLEPYGCSITTLVNGDVCYSFYIDEKTFTSVELIQLLNIDKVEFIALMPFGLDTLRFSFKVWKNEKKK